MKVMDRIPSAARRALVLLASTWLSNASAIAQSGGVYDMKWNSIDGGAQTSTGGSFKIIGTIGQADAGQMQGGSFTFLGGFVQSTSCYKSEQPVTDSSPKNRFLSLTDRNPGRLTALRVTLSNLPSPFSTLNGKSMWVGQPTEICENSGQDASVPIEECGPAPGGPGGLTLLVARLQCDPLFIDWSSMTLPINIASEFIVPGGTYSIQAVDQLCPLADESSFSSPLVITNPIWGDVIGEPCSLGGICPPPDGSVDVVTDVTAVLEMFKNSGFAPGKARSDLEPSVIDLQINISDVTFVLNAFSGSSYPFAPSTTNPCP